MDFMYWIQIVAAVMIGNAFTASVIFFFVFLSKHPANRENDISKLPLWVFPFLLVPLAFAFFVIRALPN